jgi:hypothetical protein
MGFECQTILLRQIRLLYSSSVVIAALVSPWLRCCKVRIVILLLTGILAPHVAITAQSEHTHTDAVNFNSSRRSWSHNL